jgi:hypothetical protein
MENRKMKKFAKEQNALLQKYGFSYDISLCPANFFTKIFGRFIKFGFNLKFVPNKKEVQ